MPYPMRSIEALKANKQAKRSKRAQRVLESWSIKCAVLHPDGVCPGYPHESSGKASSRPAKRKKSPTMAKLKKLLWHEISLLVRSWSPVCLGCRVNPTECAAHIVPSNEGAITRFFLPNLYPCCINCNGLEKWNRATWVFHHRDRFGEDYVDALYEMNAEQYRLPIEQRWQIKKWWVLEQTERMRRIRNANS